MPSKPSKTSLKKASKAARREKKEQQRSRAPPPSGDDTSKPGLSPPAPTVPLAHAPAPEPVKLDAVSDHRPSPPIDSPKISPPLSNTISVPNEMPRSSLNGNRVGPKGGPPRPNEDPSLSTSISQVGRPTTKDQPLPPVQPSPPFKPKPVPQPSESISKPSIPEKRLAPYASKPVAVPEANKAAKKGNNVLVRTLWTFIMIGGFMGQSDNHRSD